MYETRGTANYRTGRHRTVVYERVPSQAGVHFLNRLPNSIKDVPTPKALKTHLKRLLLSQAFYNASEFLAFDWETAQLEDSLRCTKWIALAMDERGAKCRSLPAPQDDDLLGGLLGNDGLVGGLIGDDLVGGVVGGDFLGGF
ncbi:hypothetical protein J6590_079005 [Homalodisca vitripennis]|nr:hypothetical protein J6590_079005 [Homalodisca vitripennis]